MKTAIVALSLILSFNVSASSVSGVLGTPRSAEETTSGGYKVFEAARVVNDVQDFMQSGALSASLAQKVRDIQAANSDLSETDALELLIENAQAILNN